MKTLTSKICTCVLYAHAFWIPIIYCDIFSALCKLQELPGKEKDLISTFDRFLSKRQATSDTINLQRFVNEMRFANKLISKNPRCLENPVNSYKFLYRIVRVWGQRLQQYSNCSTADNTSLPYFLNSVYNNSQSMSSWPNQIDLDGASLALIRIGNAYNIDSRHFHSGIFASTAISNLTGFDVLNIGLTASRVNHLYDAKKWLTGAIQLLSTKPKTSSLVVQAYRSLGNVYNRLNAPQLAVDVLTQALTIEPWSTSIKRDIVLYQNVVTEYVRQLRPLQSHKEIRVNHTKTLHKTQNYLELCNKELKSIEELSELFCKYQRTSIPFIQAKLEYINFQPDILVFHDVINDQETSVLKSIAKDGMFRSYVLGDDRVHREDETRISKNAWLYDTNPVVSRLSRRISLLTGFKTEVRPHNTYAEAFQVVNYGLGGLYGPHLDCLSKNGDTESEYSQFKDSGERVATWMFYLSDVEFGGATVFPRTKARIPARKGTAAFWFNTFRNGLPDSRTLHAGCPVVLGDKWVANKWLRSIGQTFIRPCALDKNL